MRFELRLRGELIGWSDPVELDRAAAIGYGSFSPGPGYGQAEPVFRLWACARVESDPAIREQLLSRYAAERSALPFELWGPDGAVWPTTSIHIVDLRSVSGEGTLELEVRFGEVY
jgi:hypothetical protein